VFVDGSARLVKTRQLWSLYWNREFNVNYAYSIPGFFPGWMPN
jgi:hypothetical protein